MSLSEGKMFTIEALNRIEGFEWPEGSEFAGLGCNTAYMAFWASVPIAGDKNFRAFLDEVCVGTEHPDWRNSLITREEFESVDGWVRNDGKSTVPDDVEVDCVQRDGYLRVNNSDNICWDFCDHPADVIKWRYHKPQKQEVKPEPESIETMIRRYKDAGENKRAAIDKLNQAQADVGQAEAIEDSLFMAIEAWAESHGVDIRVLSESEEKSELVITDWRDLRVGDEVLITLSSNKEWAALDGVVLSVSSVESNGAFLSVGNKRKWFLGDSCKFKFIRRPEEK